MTIAVSEMAWWVRCHLVLTRMAEVQCADTTSRWGHCAAAGALTPRWWAAGCYRYIGRHLHAKLNRTSPNEIALFSVHKWVKQNKQTNQKQKDKKKNPSSLWENLHIDIYRDFFMIIKRYPPRDECIAMHHGFTAKKTCHEFLKHRRNFNAHR